MVMLLDTMDESGGNGSVLGLVETALLEWLLNELLADWVLEQATNAKRKMKIDITSLIFFILTTPSRPNPAPIGARLGLTYLQLKKSNALKAL